jgi:hypothetical protein
MVHHHKAICGGLRPYVAPRVVPPQQKLDEGGLACGVLAQEQHARLGLKVALIQDGAEKGAEFEGLLYGANLDMGTSAGKN